MSLEYIEAGGRAYGRRVLVGVGSTTDGDPVRAFAPFRLSTYNALLDKQGLELAGRYMAWHASMVTEVITMRGGGTRPIDWHITTPAELIERGATL